MDIERVKNLFIEYKARKVAGAASPHASVMDQGSLGNLINFDQAWAYLRSHLGMPPPNVWPK